MRLCVFGDSTAWGAWDKEKGGWVNRLWLFYANKDSDIDVYNLSISAGTTETILKRFESEAKIRRAKYLIFQTGGNDASYDSEGKFRVESGKFRENLKEIIKKAKKITPDIIFVGFKNVDETKTVPVPWADCHYKNENILKYNQIMKEVCGEESIPFVDLFGLMEKEDLDEDGLHPSAFGHQKIFQKVKDSLLENNWI